MPIYLFWGEDDFAIAQAVERARAAILDPAWAAFNEDRIPGDQPDAMIRGLEQALTPPFGAGGRLVRVENAAVCHACSSALLAELERSLPVIPERSHLLLTTSKKPDGRLKSTKLLKRYAQVREFPTIPPWKTEEIEARARQLAEDLGVKLAPAALELLARSVGNDTRLLGNELKKLATYGATLTRPLEESEVAALVAANARNSLQLAAALREGQVERALELVGELLARDEPALKIVATLVGQFRTWTAVKLAIEDGERDERAIAAVAEVGNPKRVYFLRREVRDLEARQLLEALSSLLDLEVSLKRGAEPLSTLQTRAIELCRVLGPSRARASP